MNEQDITARFYHAVYKSVMEDRSKEIHVSDILYECLRRAWYSKHLPPRFTRDTAMIFWIGDQLHLTPISKTHELSLSWYGIHGTIDEYIDGFIIDKKSCRSLPKYPYSNHVKQVEYYSALMENNGYEVQGGFMLYIFVGTKDEKPKANARASVPRAYDNGEYIIYYQSMDSRRMISPYMLDISSERGSLNA